MDVRMAAALPDGVGDVAAFCRAQGISRQTYYKWRRRFAAEGLDGLHEHSRRPHRSPAATAAAVEDAVVLARKQLADNGEFNGPLSVRDRLLAGDDLDSAVVPSRATIARILARHGQVRPQPRKRPRSSYRRFEAGRPNEMWQSDWTEWHLGAGEGRSGGGAKVAIAATLDDHSRLLVGIRAGSGAGTGELVWAVMSAAISDHGVPMSSLTDNGLCYSTKHRGQGRRPAAFETNLAALGCQSIASTPYHPQTCGKIERFWQTLKKWLRAHGPHRTLADLNRELAIFAEHYNTRRPHRALGGRTPAAAFAATTAARPVDRPLPSTVQTYRSRVSSGGAVTVAAPPGALTTQLQVFLGRRYQFTPVTVLQDGPRVAVYSGNTLIRALDLDPTRQYQPLRNPRS